MGNIKCKECGEKGFSFCTHGKKGKKKFIKHKSGCRRGNPLKIKIRKHYK